MKTVRAGDNNNLVLLALNLKPDTVIIYYGLFAVNTTNSTFHPGDHITRYLKNNSIFAAV